MRHGASAQVTDMQVDKCFENLHLSRVVSRARCPVSLNLLSVSLKLVSASACRVFGCGSRLGQRPP